MDSLSGSLSIYFSIQSFIFWQWSWMNELDLVGRGGQGQGFELFFIGDQPDPLQNNARVVFFRVAVGDNVLMTLCSLIDAKSSDWDDIPEKDAFLVANSRMSADRFSAVDAYLHRAVGAATRVFLAKPHERQ